MARKVSSPVAALLALATLSGPADAYLARNGLIVEPVGRTGFRMPFTGRAGAADFWCAAGDYARDRLGLAPTDRIWRLTPVPRRSGEPMAFSTLADNATDKTGLVVIFGRDDGSLSVASALNRCEPIR